MRKNSKEQPSHIRRKISKIHYLEDLTLEPESQLRLFDIFCILQKSLMKTEAVKLILMYFV